MLDAIREQLAQLADPQDAAFLQRYFKTGPGEYGEGDVFRGIRVPPLRRLARSYQALPLDDADTLLQSTLHEDRLLALLILVLKYDKGDAAARAAIHELYLDSTRFINNWDLVDCSAPHLVGAHLYGSDQSLLGRLALSPSLWELRIAIMATFHDIGRKDSAAPLRIAEALLADREDLIHKAVGWMLREVGKRDLACEEAFLAEHYRRMPRTMLRYAIERFPEERRQDYLKGRV